jgi:serine/threonine protein kinase
MNVNYAAPEQLYEDFLSIKTDIWAFGGIIYRIFAGEDPFKDKNYSVILMYLLENKNMLIDENKVESI